MDTDLYTLPVEALMVRLKVSVTEASWKKDGQPWWQAWKTSGITGEGETPREAVIDWFKKQNR